MNQPLTKDKILMIDTIGQEYVHLKDVQSAVVLTLQEIHNTDFLDWTNIGEARKTQLIRKFELIIKKNFSGALKDER